MGTPPFQPPDDQTGSSPLRAYTRQARGRPPYQEQNGPTTSQSFDSLPPIRTTSPFRTNNHVTAPQQPDITNSLTERTSQPIPAITSSNHRRHTSSPELSAEASSPQRSGPLEWWYRLTAPPPASPKANFAQQELARRGRLGSAILLAMLLFLLFSVPIGFLEPNHPVLQVLIPSLAVSVIVLILNRMGKLLIAGIVLVVGFELGYAIGLLTTPGGLGINNLPQYYLFIEPLLLAVSFLPPRTVFLVASINSIFIWTDLALQPHTTELANFLHTYPFFALEAPIGLQILVAVVTYLWVSSTMRATQRADRAEALAALEHMVVEQKQQLEAGIQAIIQTHVRVANGDFSARAPLSKDNVLWQLSVSFNNLLTRFQRLSHAERELHVTQQALQRTNQALQQAREEARTYAEALRRAQRE